MVEMNEFEQKMEGFRQDALDLDGRMQSLRMNREAVRTEIDKLVTRKYRDFKTYTLNHDDVEWDTLIRYAKNNYAAEKALLRFVQEHHPVFTGFKLQDIKDSTLVIPIIKVSEDSPVVDEKMVNAFKKLANRTKGSHSAVFEFRKDSRFGYRPAEHLHIKSKDLDSAALMLDMYDGRWINYTDMQPTKGVIEDIMRTMLAE